MTPQEKIQIQKALRKELDVWLDLTTFQNVDDIPDLPVVEQERWENYYIPLLIKNGAIPKENLEVGATYLGKCRNADEAVWDGEQFHYHRTKFGNRCIEKINQFQDDDGFGLIETINHFQDNDGFDLFVPIKKLN